MRLSTTRKEKNCFLDFPCLNGTQQVVKFKLGEGTADEEKARDGKIKNVKTEIAVWMNFF